MPETINMIRIDSPSGNFHIEEIDDENLSRKYRAMLAIL